MYHADCRSGSAAGACHCHAHLSAGYVGDAAHGVNGFVSCACADQHTLAAQGFGGEIVGQQIGDFCGFAHASHAAFAAGLFAVGGHQDVYAVGLQLSDVAAVGGFEPHFCIHGGGENQGAFAGGGHFRNQVVGYAVGDFGNGVGGGGGNQHDVGGAGGVDVRHSAACAALFG